MPFAWLSAIGYWLFTMPHSVESHLQLQVTEYDEINRILIPRDDEMLDEAVHFIRNSVVDTGKLVDLGIGTGSLTERVIRATPKAQIIGIDTDPKMLEEAARRLSSIQDRIELRLQDFLSELPPRQNAYFAALALHHVPNLSLKQKLYQKIYDALLPGGLFLNAVLCSTNRIQTRNESVGLPILCLPTSRHPSPLIISKAGGRRITILSWRSS